MMKKMMKKIFVEISVDLHLNFLHVLFNRYVKFIRKRILLYCFFKDNIDKLILIECLTALQTTLCSLPIEHARENSLSLDDLINEMRMMVATNQLADTSIDTPMDE
jgi:hypothetical protein